MNHKLKKVWLMEMILVIPIPPGTIIRDKFLMLNQAEKFYFKSYFNFVIFDIIAYSSFKYLMMFRQIFNRQLIPFI